MPVCEKNTDNWGPDHEWKWQNSKNDMTAEEISVSYSHLGRRPQIIDSSVLFPIHCYFCQIRRFDSRIGTIYPDGTNYPNLTVTSII